MRVFSWCPWIPGTLDYLISDSQVIRDSLSHFGEKLIDSLVINDSEVKLENRFKQHGGINNRLRELFLLEPGIYTSDLQK